MILDKRGNIQQQHVLDINELIVDEPDDIQVRKFETQTIKKSQLRQKEGSVQSNTFLWQVLWCDNGDEPVLIIAHTNHLLRVMFDCSTKTWKADINRILDQQGWISSLASINGYIYTGEIDKSGRRRRTMKRVLQSTKSCSTTGSNEGLWEIGSQDMLSQSKLGKFPTTVICVSAEYLAAGDEQGGIVLFQGGPNSWSQIQRIQEKLSNCCTSMFILEARGENGNLSPHPNRVKESRVIRMKIVHKKFDEKIKNLIVKKWDGKLQKKFVSIWLREKNLMSFFVVV
jgi:hypothetical protein